MNLQQENRPTASITPASKSEKMPLIVWDFNGTLLNDVETCLDALNVILRQRELQPLNLVEYRQRFTFPVSTFYQNLHIETMEDVHWEALAESFHMRYIFSRKLVLQPGAADVVKIFKTLGIRQGVLSALEQELLETQLQQFGLFESMDFVCGSKNYNGASKTEAARALGLGNHVLLVGDTLHDAEVAASQGWKCILFSEGHQVRERLLVAGVPVIDTLARLPELLFHDKE
ncbi:MAG: HAD hydrolase-like protein [Kiritimatiellia bacterium]